jgi:hypothetical protein
MPGLDTSHPGYEPTVSSGEELVVLLRAQHDDLAVALSRLLSLTGAAREDEFLQVRRKLAVHEALEAVLVGARLPGGAAPDPVDCRDEVVAAEQQPREAWSFVEAAERLLATQLRHAEVQERSVLQLLSGDLTQEERAVVGTALSLWHGEGDVYLGNSFGDMQRTAAEQLAAAPEPGHAPPGEGVRPAPRS